MLRRNACAKQDEAYNRVHAGCLAASSRLGDSTLAVVGLLHRGAAAAPAGEFRAVVLHLRVLAAKDLDSIDFFWPQVQCSAVQLQCSTQNTPCFLLLFCLPPAESEITSSRFRFLFLAVCLSVCLSVLRAPPGRGRGSSKPLSLS